MVKLGALPSQEIKRMMQRGVIAGAGLVNVKPGSLDLTLSPEIYRVEGIFLPRPGEIVRDTLKDLGAIKHDFVRPLERDVTYLARIKERFCFDYRTYAHCNPKSSTGRNDVQVRILADGISRYDILPAKFRGQVWIAITPKSFPIKIFVGETLSQIRFFNKDTTLDEKQLEDSLKKDLLLWDKTGEHSLKSVEIKIKDRDNSFILTIDLEQGLDTAGLRAQAGWECLGDRKILDFSKINHYAPLDFFRPLKVVGGKINMQRGGFYILHAKERVLVPPHLACEMVPMDARSGEFRTHYAGFIDPGYGWGKKGEGRGRQLVLEIRPFEDLVLRDSQPAAKIKFEKMSELPKIPYDALSGSNYTFDSATPRLSKHFKVS